MEIWGGRVGLNEDSIDLGGALEIVRPGDRELFRIGAGSNLNDCVGTGGIERRLNRAKAGRLTAASRGGVADIKSGLLGTDA